MSGGWSMAWILGAWLYKLSHMDSENWKQCLAKSFWLCYDPSLVECPALDFRLNLKSAFGVFWSLYPLIDPCSSFWSSHELPCFWIGCWFANLITEQTEQKLPRHAIHEILKKYNFYNGNRIWCLFNSDVWISKNLCYSCTACLALKEYQTKNIFNIIFL